MLFKKGEKYGSILCKTAWFQCFLKDFMLKKFFLPIKGRGIWFQKVIFCTTERKNTKKGEGYGFKNQY